MDGKVAPERRAYTLDRKRAPCVSELMGAYFSPSTAELALPSPLLTSEEFCALISNMQKVPFAVNPYVLYTYNRGIDGRVSVIRSSDATIPSQSQA